MSAGWRMVIDNMALDAEYVRHYHGATERLTLGGLIRWAWRVARDRCVVCNKKRDACRWPIPTAVDQ